MAYYIIFADFIIAYIVITVITFNKMVPKSIFFKLILFLENGTGDGETTSQTLRVRMFVADCQNIKWTPSICIYISETRMFISKIHV